MLACARNSPFAASCCLVVNRLGLIAQYDDVLATLKDNRFAKDRYNSMRSEQLAKQAWIPDFARPLMRNMLDQLK